MSEFKDVRLEMAVNHGSCKLIAYEDWKSHQLCREVKACCVWMARCCRLQSISARHVWCPVAKDNFQMPVH